MTNVLRIAVAGTALALCLTPPAAAQGGFNGPGYYEITNSRSGKALDLDRNDQTTVIQFSPRGTDNQVWEIQSIGAGFYSLRSAMNGNALEAIGNRNSTPVRATRFNGGPGQQWRFDMSRDGHTRIVSRMGKVLDIPNGTDADGARVQIHDANNGNNQEFTFRQVSGNQAFGPIGNAGPSIITCSSNNGRRTHCSADTRGEVRLVRQLGGSACQEGSTWGYDSTGVWVDRGCQAEFDVSYQDQGQNRDGVITRQEWRGDDQSFRRLDRNGDGVLSGNEVPSDDRRWRGRGRSDDRRYR